MIGEVGIMIHHLESRHPWPGGSYSPGATDELGHNLGCMYSRITQPCPIPPPCRILYEVIWLTQAMRWQFTSHQMSQLPVATIHPSPFAGDPHQDTPLLHSLAEGKTADAKVRTSCLGVYGVRLQLSGCVRSRTKGTASVLCCRSMRRSGTS